MYTSQTIRSPSHSGYVYKPDYTVSLPQWLCIQARLYGLPPTVAMYTSQTIRSPSHSGYVYKPDYTVSLPQWLCIQARLYGIPPTVAMYTSQTIDVPGCLCALTAGRYYSSAPLGSWICRPHSQYPRTDSPPHTGE